MESDQQRTSCYRRSMSSEDDKSLISFIATTVESMREQMATKADLVRIESRMETMREQMATKDGLARLEHSLREEMASKDDLARLATKVRGDFEQVHFRFDTLERVMSTRFGQLETDISRIRSVLYLLVKDKPDMLRLLGQPTSGKRRPPS